MKTTRREIMTAAAIAAIPALAPAQSAVSAFTLPALPYATDALEPYIDAATMQLHHDKHHQAYVDNLNKAVGGDSALAKLSVEELLRRLDPCRRRSEPRSGTTAADTRITRCSGKPFAPLPRAASRLVHWPLPWTARLEGNSNWRRD